MWAFEWIDTTKPLILKRGKPLFYVQFETQPQDRAVQLCLSPLELCHYLCVTGGIGDGSKAVFG